MIRSIRTDELAVRLSLDGIGISIGGATVRLRSDVDGLAVALQAVYGQYPLEPSAGFFDATIEIRRVAGFRRYFRPQIELILDAATPFEPFPADTHLPLMEWGMNHALAERYLHSLLLHAGVVEKRGVAVVLPAVPGSGKSTLTAALMCSGYRLLSDEFGALSLATGMLTPMLKPIALKNESIPEIRRRYPQATMGPVFPRTRKGDVGHLAPDARSIELRSQPGLPRLVLFPTFVRGASVQLDRVDAATAFGKLAVNSFNYEFLGIQSFDAVARLVTTCTCKRIVFSDLSEAVQSIDHMVDDLAGGQSIHCSGGAGQ
ncbi:MAG: HprK-related kinase A [Burkholderiales bacterium]